MSGPRSNLSYHSPEIRQRVYRLHYEGRTGAEIVADPDVAGSVKRTGYRIHGNTLTAAWKSAEYQTYVKERTATEKRVGANRWAAEALRDCAGIVSIADMAQMALLEQLRDLAENGAGDPNDLLKLANAVTRIKSSETSRKVDELTAKLADQKRLSDVAESEWRNREAELVAEIAHLTARIKELEAAIPGVDSTRVADEMKKKFGV